MGAPHTPPLKPANEHEYVVACLCAAWCHTCADYYEGFFALSREFPQAEFRWLDIEDDAELVGELDVENFPTVLVQRADVVLFYGAQVPVHRHLRRLLAELIR